MMKSGMPSGDTLNKLVKKNPAGFKAGIFAGKKNTMVRKFKKPMKFIGDRKLTPNG